MTRAARAPALLLAASVLVVSAYWGYFASDRYVSQTHIVVQRTDAPQGQPANMLALIANTTDMADALWLRDRLLSIDMMLMLDKQFDLRKHYSNPRRDLFSRLRDPKASDEDFYDYYRTRISAHYDEYAKTLVVKVQAFCPMLAQRVARALVDEGERYMNRLSNDLASEQASFIEEQLAHSRNRMEASQEALLLFQNTHGLVSPAATLESISQVVARLESERAALEASRLSLSGFLTASAPDMIKVTAKIAALELQILSERGRLATGNGAPDSPHQRLNRLTDDQRHLQREAVFAEDVYKASLAALEKARIESVRKVRRMAVLQSANLPQSATQPRRLYNIAAYTLVALLITGIVYLLSAIIREHRD